MKGLFRWSGQGFFCHVYQPRHSFLLLPFPSGHPRILLEHLYVDGLMVFTRCRVCALPGGTYPLTMQARGTVRSGSVHIIQFCLLPFQILLHRYLCLPVLLQRPFCFLVSSAPDLCLYHYLTAGWTFLLGWPLLQDIVRGTAGAHTKSLCRTPFKYLFLVLSALHLPPCKPIREWYWNISVLRQPSWSPMLVRRVPLAGSIVILHSSLMAPCLSASCHSSSSTFPFPCFLCQVSLLCLSPWWQGPLPLSSTNFAHLQEVDRFFLL